jgi:hypothetical protein
VRASIAARDKSELTELTLSDLTDELAAHAAHMSAGMCPCQAYQLSIW